jgi:DNA gyrase/topoisomerase IV subunit B
MDIEIVSAVAAVRCRPQLYLGELQRDELFDDLILEALCHAIEAGIDRTCNHINMT